jgi:hypothetical protein
MVLQFVMTTVLVATPAAVAPSDGKRPAKPKDIDYQVHGGYFEKNNSDLTGAASYLAFTGQVAFDKVFGVGFTMGKKPNVLPENAFASRMVVAVIKRGGQIWQYEVRKVSAADGVLTVRYAATGRDGGSARFASPLIVSVPRGKYTKVVFIEKGKDVGTVTVGK